MCDGGLGVHIQTDDERWWNAVHVVYVIVLRVAVRDDGGWMVVVEVVGDCVVVLCNGAKDMKLV